MIESPSNTSSSWPPIMFTYASGQPASAARRRHSASLASLLPRSYGDALGTTSRLAPACLATETGPPSCQRSSQIATATSTGSPDPAVILTTGSDVARHEVPVLVEDAVVRQVMLGRGNDDRAAVQHRRGVERRSGRQAHPRRQSRLPVQVAGHHGDVAQAGLGEPGGSLPQRGDRRLYERRAQRQVLDRIAGEHHFGEQDHPGACGGRLRGPADDGGGVAVEVADGGIDLSERDPKLGHEFSLEPMLRSSGGSRYPAETRTRQTGDVDRQEEFVLHTLEERNIRFVRLWFTDVLGYLKSVAVAPAELEGAFAEGIGFDGSAIEGFSRVYEADMIAKPDPSTFQLMPLRGDPVGVGRMFCDILLPDGSPSPRRPAVRAQAGADQGGRTWVHLLHPPRDRVLPAQGAPRGRREAAADRPGRLLRPHAAQHRARLPQVGDRDAGEPWASRSSSAITRVRPDSRRSTCATPTR